MKMNEFCGCEKPEPSENILNPQHGQVSVCKNCRHLIYFQFDHWEHYTRAYKAWEHPYTTVKCYTPLTKGDEK